VPRHKRALVEKVHELGNTHLLATLGVLAVGLPVFEVQFHSGEDFTVTEVQAADPAKRAGH
jgi:hypothetical protein